MDQPAIRHADSDADLQACFDVMRQLRPRLHTAEQMLAALAPQRAQGYRLLVCWQGSRPLALAGYRKLDNLIHGSFLYVDDLVTCSSERGLGHGARLLAALRGIGAERGCGQLVLDTALSNEGAQRFYRRVGMEACALHFRQQM
ncbi:GNAT family N-acetyltransferase [Pseudoduganella ginsengisoli]|uniref:GNAT family N-acetyltransferase n=1 Tax=Pseudoduganella ginsengisoli TaxID=1462440 RepID=A0A6L6Q641_9BURK|nr:GNAT family N-acetyltransferase [Pseudoduganella ginsengisoli]MTW04976.1 GNAT family N-acetyltransferase [Pseudoduganella ginsengisoli]